MARRNVKEGDTSVGTVRTEVSVDNTSKVITWLGNMLRMLKQYGISKIIMSALIIAVLSLFFFLLFNPSKLFDAYDGWKAVRHAERTELREEITPKIQSLIDKLTFQIDASRTIVLELHNGTTGTGGLPFNKCTATFEADNLEVKPVYDQYNDIALSLMPFTAVLFTQGYWAGSTDELIGIDRGLAYKMKSNGTEYFIACIIEGIDEPLSILIVSYPSAEKGLLRASDAREYIRHVAMEISVLLEVERQVRKH